ncbi:MAG: sigma 54-interacting transcriptional regulator [Nitrospiraceae bacterium]|nr:MAG: sigma 54-interacting transcriptional regulator [Nitrospiraceae bacterium]
MLSPDDINYRLNDLKLRLEQVNRSWTINDYETLLKFYVGIVPKILDAERCSIFIVEPGTDRIWLKCGTGLAEKEIMPPREGSIVGNAITSGNWIIANELEESEYLAELASKTDFITRNLICAPIKSLTGQGITGAIEVLNKCGAEQFTPSDGELLQEIADYLSMALENILLNQEILQVSNRLNREIDIISRENIEFVAKSRVMKNILNTVRVVSQSPVNVLIHGESGTGKELVARMIHNGSDRRDKPFVPVNCAAIPENLMESEFFGYEKGAFTGAVSSKKGRFEEADGGTLFMDEIREMPLVIQPKFLRVIQEGEGYRLGSNKQFNYNFRVISATNKDLREEVANGLFREDLFYRIFSVDIYIPPLRERREDIVQLAMFFTSSVSKRFQKKTAGFSPEVLNFFEEYCWPGNVRQLLHEVERLIALTPEREKISLEHCSQELLNWRTARPVADTENESSMTLPQQVKVLEIRTITDILHKTGGNKLQASKLLGITRPGLDKKMKRYGIKISS